MYGRREDLTVSHLARFGRFDYGVDRTVFVVVFHYDFDFNLRHEVNTILSASVDFAMTALATALAGAAVTAPAQTYWIAGVTGAAGLAVIGVRRGDESANPVLRQSVNVLDYLSAAAVVPLATWAGGLYDLSRNLGLP